MNIFKKIARHVKQTVARLKAIKAVRRVWYKIPKDQYDPRYDMLGIDILVHLNRKEHGNYLRNLTLRRDICQSQGNYRLYRRLWKEQSRLGNIREKRAYRKIMNSYKDFAHQGRERLWGDDPPKYKLFR